MQQIDVQLYGRTSNTFFTEELSILKKVVLKPTATTIELALDAPEGEKFVEIRLDPDNKPSAFALCGLTIWSADGEELFAWNGEPRQLGKVEDVEFRAGRQGTIVESISNDPFLIIPLDKPQSSIVLAATVAQDLLDSGPQDLAEAVLSLQSSVRAALDEVAAEQEGLQEALTLAHAHSQAEIQRIQESLTELKSDLKALESAAAEARHESQDLWGSLGKQMESRAGRTVVEIRRINSAIAELKTDLKSTESEAATAREEARDLRQSLREQMETGAARTVGEIRRVNSAIAELKAELKTSESEAVTAREEARDLWRSLRQQIEDHARDAERSWQNSATQAALTSQTEFDKLMQAVHGLGNSRAILENIRQELGVTCDVDAIAEIQRLKSEAQEAQSKVQQIETSLAGRLTRPFRSR